MKSLFYDTYALIEIAKGNPNYEDYKKDIKIITTKLNLMEIYYYFIKVDLIKEAEIHFNRLLPFCINIPDRIIKKAMFFKKDHKNLSYIDCIGYCIALEENIKFLTGDNQFKNLNNTIFLK